MQSVPYINLVLLASIPGYRDRDKVEVPRDVWPFLRDNVLENSESLTIALDSGALPNVHFPDDGDSAAEAINQPAFNLFLSDLQGSEWAYSESRCSPSAASSTAVSPGPTLQPVITRRNDFSPPSIPDGRDDSYEFRAKKPVIYLYPPDYLPDVTVQLNLTPSWSFSAVYPSAQSTIQSGEGATDAQSLTWAVQAEADGRLREKTTGTEVTYLYWEAE